MKKILIIGGGASGMMAALVAKNEDNHVTIIEKNKTLGQKLSITGGGRCNITNTNEKEEFFKNIVRGEKFFYKSFYQFSNYDLMSYLQDMGIRLKTQGDRVYPQNDSAQKLVNTFIKKLSEKNIKLNLNEEMTDIIIADKKVNKISTNKVDYFYDKDFTDVIIATGGLSYTRNKTFDILKDKLKLTKLYPSLVPVHTVCDFSNLAGISLEDVSVSCVIDGKRFAARGEFLFTNKGVSGRSIMDMSAYIVPFQDDKSKTSDMHGEKCVSYKNQKIVLSVDFLPNMSDEEICDIIFSSSAKKLRTKLSSYIPLKLSTFLLRRYDDVDIHNMKKVQRQEVVNLIKDYKIAVKSYGDIRGAIVTKGGIDTSIISPKTMQIRDIDNLYVAGECIDIDALEGGYNLQIAFSTGYTAGAHLGGF